jgi:mono/diheme cytochrome c family protein
VTFRFALSLLVILAAFAAFTTFPRSSARANSPAVFAASAAPPESPVDRGHYLVEHVAQCGECHTPRDANGNTDASRTLQGAPVWIMPVRPDPNWAERVPAIAGMVGYTDEQMQQILEHGIGPNGLALRRPMHSYHLRHDDAMAIIAYLKSLPTGLSPQ